MAYSTTYPPGQVSLLGTKELVENRFPHITYVGRDGTKFYLAGPLAPTAGAQNGVVALSVKGLAPPFQHLDNQGARQDGTTWYDALYDPAEIDIQCEVSGITTADTRSVIRSWLGSWDAKQRGRLHVFTPENGEWWARVRQLKQFDDPLMHTYEKYGKQRFTWAARNDDAFWESFDSVDQFGMTSLVKVTDDFTGPSGTTLGSNWIQTYYGDSDALGTLGLDGNGNAVWSANGAKPRGVINRNATPSATDDQVISVTFDAPVAFDFFGGVFINIWGRMDASGNGIKCQIGGNGVFDSVTLFSIVNGVTTKMWTQPLLIPPLWNEKWTLICGTSEGHRHYKVQRGGFTIINYTETGTASPIGAGHRGYGWGADAGAGLSLGGLGTIAQVAPPSIGRFEAGDNNMVAQTGFVNLQNRGDQEAWPRYLCYGPGTFTFSDGPAPSDNTITFGPLLEGQIVLVTTLPRLRGVVDLSPSQSTQTLDQFQSIVEGLIDFATNYNVPPLLQQFESSFGIVPPQGVLYSLLQGRFTTPLPAKIESQLPTNSQIAVSIVGGNADTKIVAAVTPLRKWPL